MTVGNLGVPHSPEAAEPRRTPPTSPAVLASRGHAVVLAAIGLLFMVLAARWDWATPPFDNPDEPAHWNYVRFVAETGTLPILHPGDYPEQQVAQLKTAKFPPGSDIDAIRYESHQPPLYYALAAVVYKLTAGLPLRRHVEVVRLLATLCGLLTIGASWRLVRALLPAEPALALATAAFVAFVPMHVNMAAAIDNDAPGDLLLTLTVLGLLLWLQRGFAWRGAAILGLVLGLAALTKVTTLVGFPLALLAAGLRYRRAGRDPGHAHPFGVLLLACAVSLAVWGWWVGRNLVTYSMHDPLALAVNQLVVTQPLTGPLNLAAARRFATITFDSFWAQFGWMGIPVPRVYPPLAGLSLLAALGLLVALCRALRTEVPPLARRQKAAEVLLVLAWPALVLATDIQYNLTFIQAQGRYLFPALGGIGFCWMLGLSRLAGPRLSTVTLLTVSLLLASLAAILLQTVVLPAWR